MPDLEDRDSDIGTVLSVARLGLPRQSMLSVYARLRDAPRLDTEFYQA